MAEGDRPKAKARAKRGQLTDKSQSKRFIEASKTHGIEEVGEPFEHAVKAVLKTIQSPSSSFRGKY